MSWSLKPKLPDDATFSGQIVYGATNYEFPDTFLNYVESVNFGIYDQFIIKNTGFEKNKYRRHDNSIVQFRIVLVGNLPIWARELLSSIANSMNSAGMILQFSDNFVTGTTDTPVTYDCRWLNAADFVENSELLGGGSIDLIGFASDPTIAVTEYQKVINTPGSGLEWVYNIGTGGGITEYQRVI